MSRGRPGWSNARSWPRAMARLSALVRFAPRESGAGGGGARSRRGRPRRVRPACSAFGGGQGRGRGEGGRREGGSARRRVRVGLHEHAQLGRAKNGVEGERLPQLGRAQYCVERVGRRLGRGVPEAPSRPVDAQQDGDDEGHRGERGEEEDAGHVEREDRVERARGRRRARWRPRQPRRCGQRGR